MLFYFINKPSSFNYALFTGAALGTCPASLLSELCMICTCTYIISHPSDVAQHLAGTRSYFGPRDHVFSPPRQVDLP